MFIKKFSEKVIAFSLCIIIIDTLISSIEIDGNQLGGWDFLCVRVIACFLGIYLIKKLGIWQSAYFSAGNFGLGVLLGLPLIIIGLASGIITNIVNLGEAQFLGLPTLLLFTVSMFFVGLAEEVVYRGLILNNMLEKWGRNYFGVWKAVLCSAALFGIAHLPNMFFAPVLTVLVQTINAAAAGILFSVIYIKSRNIWSAVAVHALTDWFALIMQICFTGTSIIATEMTLPQAVFTVMAGSLPPIFFAWLYMGKKKDAIAFRRVS